MQKRLETLTICAFLNSMFPFRRRPETQGKAIVKTDLSQTTSELAFGESNIKIFWCKWTMTGIAIITICMDVERI